MAGVCNSLLLLFLIVNPCVPELVSRQDLVLRERDDGVDIKHKEDAPTEQQQPLIKPENDDGLGSDKEKKEKDGSYGRSELTHTHLSDVYRRT